MNVTKAFARLGLTLILGAGLAGCSTPVPPALPPATKPGQTTQTALAALHRGMTLGEADQTLLRLGGIRIFSVSSAERRSYHYVFLPLGNEVLLQFDSHNRLARWGDDGNDEDRQLTAKISAILAGCQRIKPGMTRTALLQEFTTEGGLSTAMHRTYVYRRCPLIKVQVDFAPADPAAQAENPGDTIVNISKPYLEWGIVD